MNTVVVKVGGSLYDWTPLRSVLPRFLQTLPPARVRIVPGGGPFADAVRLVDRVHGLGDEPAHWLALKSLSLAAEFLRCLVPAWSDAIVDMLEFARQDETRPDHLPHVWDVTSDSLAARVAHIEEARRLILLKSADPTPNGRHTHLVDPLFDAVAARGTFCVEFVNLRTWQPEVAIDAPNRASEG